MTLVSEPRETAAERLRQSKIHAVIWDWGLQLLPMNEEFPVSAIHHIALITSLPFVHTARRYYRLEVLVRHLDLQSIERGNSFRDSGEVCRTQISRGSKSRNKVSVGEPAEGSLQVYEWYLYIVYFKSNTTREL